MKSSFLLRQVSDKKKTLFAKHATTFPAPSPIANIIPTNSVDLPLLPHPALPPYLHLSQQAKVWLVCDQRQHDQIRVQAVQAVALVGGVARLALLPPDVLHDLVLTLTRHIMACSSCKMMEKVTCMLGTADSSGASYGTACRPAK